MFRGRGNYCGVSLGAEHDLWRSIESGNDVLGQFYIGGVLAGVACEPEIADPDIATLVGQNVAGLDVPVDNPAGVQKFEAAEYLVHNILDVVIGEIILRFFDQGVEVNVHQIGYQVHFSKIQLWVLVENYSFQ